MLLLLCCHTGLFALRELCKLLDADVGVVLQLVQQERGLLDVPATSVEDNTRVRLRLAGVPCAVSALQSAAGTKLSRSHWLLLSGT
jgi:hypothetical protein